MADLTIPLTLSQPYLDKLWAEPHSEVEDCLLHHIAVMQRENAKLREALTFYAQDRNYWEDYKDSIWRTTAIAEDRGDKARDALSDQASEYSSTPPTKENAHD